MGRDVLGEFEHQVMLAIVRLGSESYSVPIVQELGERTGREVAPAAVYVALRRLEEEGLAESRLSDGDDGGGGRTRRYFTITPEGMERLRESRQTFVSLWDGIAPLIDEGAGREG